MPRSCGGLNLRNLVLWNTAALMKHFWSIALKEDRLWVQWIHSYYIKGRDVMSCSVLVTASWEFKKIMKLRCLIEQWGGWSSVMDKNGVFSIKLAYKLLLGHFDRMN